MASSNHSTKYVEEMLECSVCLDTVREPHTLKQCFHTYCKECVDQLIDKQKNQPPGVKCPVCRTFSPKEDIRDNFFIKDLVEMHRNASQSGEKLCDQCPQNAPEASWKCLECKSNFCKNCHLIHLKIPVCKGHRVIPLTEDTEVIVDRLVFCESHPDKTVELYCEPCNKAICLMCKATTHDSHKSLSVDDALKEMVPDIETSSHNLDEHLETISKSIHDVSEKILQTAAAFEECENQVAKVANERVNQIRASEKKLKEELATKKKAEIVKLEDLKTSLEGQQKEVENVQRVARTSLKRAKHASLLSELVNGGLNNKIESVKSKKDEKLSVQVNKPEAQVNQREWQTMLQAGLLGKIVFTIMNMFVMTGSVKEVPSDSRFWPVSFKDYFSKPFKKVLEIDLPKRCSRFAVINNEIWAPLQSKCISIYNKEGAHVRNINITRPVSAEQSYNGDIFIACCNNNGLYLISKDDPNPRKIYAGSFSDVCSFQEKMFALEHEETYVLEFICDELSVWKESRKINLSIGHGLDENDTLLIRQTLQSNLTGNIEIIVGVRWQYVVSQFNESGEMTKQYGMEQQLNLPHLCGLDMESNILIADGHHNEYKILDAVTGQFTSTGISCDGIVYDAKIDSDGILWTVHVVGTRFGIAKYNREK